jgi:hypothetical protein
MRRVLKKYQIQIGDDVYSLYKYNRKEALHAAGDLHCNKYGYAQGVGEWHTTTEKWFYAAQKHINVREKVRVIV